jgi:hypothetical protein
MIYPKHPIRSLLTSMLRKANIRYPSDVFTFSFEKYKEKWLRGIVYVHDVLSSTAYKYAPNLESLLTQQYVCVNVHSDLIIHAFLLISSNHTCSDCNALKTLHVWENVKSPLLYFSGQWNFEGVSCSKIFFLKSTPVLNNTFNNISVISWQSVSLVEETAVHGEKPRPAASRWQNLSHNASKTPRLSWIQTRNVSCDRHWLHSYKSNCHMMTVPQWNKMAHMICLWTACHIVFLHTW